MLTILGLAPVSFVSLSTRSIAAPSRFQMGQRYASPLIDLTPTRIDRYLIQFEEIRAARDGRHLVLTYPNISTSRANPILHDGL